MLTLRRVGTSGNSIAVRIPRRLGDLARIGKGTTVTIEYNGNGLVITAVNVTPQLPIEKTPYKWKRGRKVRR